MARKRMAVGGVKSLNNLRNYWFNENDEIVEPSSSTVTSVSNTDTQEPIVQQRTTPSRSQSNNNRLQDDSTSEGIVTIGTRTFGEAFKQARTAGLDKFRWKGKVYGTKYASEVGNKRNTTRRINRNVNRTTNTPRTTYTRDNNNYTQSPAATVTARSRQNSKPASRTGFDIVRDAFNSARTYNSGNMSNSWNNVNNIIRRNLMNSRGI